MKKTVKTIILLLVFALASVIAACFGGMPENAVELGDAEMESLLEQVDKSGVNPVYSEYLEHETFAVAKIFGVTKDGDQGNAYVDLCEGGYVIFKGKAYEMSFSETEAIIKFKYTDSGVTLTEVVRSANGSLHDDWMKENFPAPYLNKMYAYRRRDKNGRLELSVKLDEKAGKALGVPVESDSHLTIDFDNGTYKIIKWRENDDDIIVEGNFDYKFDHK